MCRIWKLQEDFATFDLINWNCLLFLLYNETNNEQNNCRNYQKQSIY